MGKVVGIELGTANTKVVVGNKVKNNFELLEYRIIKNSEGVYGYDGHLDINELAPSLTQTLKEMKALRKKCYLTVSSTKSIVRNRTFPLVKKKELDAMVKLEAEQFLPYEADAFYIDYRVIEVNELEDDKSLNVMVVAVPKQILDEAVELIEKCKLHLECVNVFTDAIHSYYKSYFPESDENTLIADIGYNHVRMVAFRGKEYFANIVSEVGIGTIENFYIEHYGILENELNGYLFDQKALSKESYKKINKDETYSDFGTLSFSDMPDELSMQKDNESSISDALQLQQQFDIEYTDILKELSKMLSYFTSRKYGSKIDKILLCGGGARAVGLMDAIEEDTDIETYFLTHKDHHKNEETMLLIATIGTIMRG